MERFIKSVFKTAKKRTVAIALAAVMLIGMVPMMWPAVNAADTDCGLDEHTHSEACYRLTCAPDGEDHVLTGEHTHDDTCRTLVCEIAEHTHTEACEADNADENADENAGENAVQIAEPENEGASPRAGGASISVSGVWDYGSAQGNENIRFGSDATATIEHNNYLESETVTVRITATFPDGATNKKLKITLKEGLTWLINGAANIPESTLESVSALQNESTVYGQKLGNGAYTYSFANGVETVDIEIMVKKTILTNFRVISDAIVAEASCTRAGAEEKATSSLKKLMPEQVELVQNANNKYSAFVKPDQTVFIIGSPIVINSYTSGSGVSHRRLYEYVEVTYEAPSDILLVTGANAHPGNSVSNTATAGWKLISQETAGDVTTYVFRIEKLAASAIGLTPEWNIPSDRYAPDDQVVVKAKKIEWKLYGDDTSYSRNGTGTLTYTVVDPNKRNEIVAAGTYSHDIQYRTDSPDAVYQLTGWSLRNDGTDPSAPKIVEFEFDTEKIGVTDVTLVAASGQKITTVWYKLKGDTEWREKSVNLSGTSALGNVLVTNVALGLNEDDYFAAFKYELDFVDNNGTASDTSDDFRYGIRPNTTSTAYNGRYVPIAGVYLGPKTSGTTATSYVRVYDKTEEGQTIQSDTGKVALKSVYSTGTYNYLQVDNKNAIQASAGTTIHHSADISATWRSSTTFPYCVGFTHYPIIYIRDETGEGISNVQLINSDGVDILSEYSSYVEAVYSHTETEDFNGDGKLAMVYKIDTRPLAEMALKEDRYAAAVGCFRSDGVNRKLTLKYTITPPSTYGDGQTVHYMYDAIMLSDASITSATNRNTAMQFADPYDVNRDGATSGVGVLKPASSNMTGYYMILSRADISVSASIKKASDAEYTKWDGTGDHFPFEPDVEYAVDFGILNGSGNPTSIEPDKITYVYIPIPVKGDEWGEINRGVDKDGTEISEFAFTAKLTGAIVNPDKAVYDIEYAQVDTSVFSDSDDVSVVGTTIRNSPIDWGEFSPNANCVRIALKGMPSSKTPVDFVLPISADSSEVEKGETNIFCGLYFEDITDDQNRRHTGWFTSDRIAVQITWGEISGRFWEDLNGNGLQDADEPGMKNVQVTLVSNDPLLSPKTGTDENGEYRFTNLPLGEYYVSFCPDFNTHFISPKNVGSSTKLDSDAAAVYNDEADRYTQACINDIVIPYTDSLGRQTYVADSMDAGFVPYVNVSYAWRGDSEYDIPAGAAIPDNGGKFLAGTKFTAGVVEPVAGYTFDGWYTDEALTRKFVDGTAITADVALHGKWSANEYTITFDTNGGSAIAPITQKYGTAVTAPADPTRIGHTFMGWDKDIPDTVPAKDVTITAQWELNEYTITFDANGGSAIAPITQGYGTAITAPSDPTRTGHTFMGWDKDIPDTMPEGDITITAQWEINRYDIVYNVVGDKPNKAVLPENVTVDYNTKYTAKVSDAISGYTFDGWYTDAGCTTKYTDGTAITEDIALYGRWTRNTVSVNGTKKWVENGEGFVRPQSVTINLLRNDVLLDSHTIDRDTAVTEQSYAFTDLYETDEDGKAYTYTVEEENVPDGYVSVTSGYDVTNTYNVDRFIISKIWDNTGNPAAAPESVDVELYRDDVLYRTVTLTEENEWTQTVTVPRLSAQGHTFTIKEIAVSGYSTVYEAPTAEDTDGDDAADTVTYVIRNAYIMPKVTVSGSVTWKDVPDGMTEPEMTVNLVLGGEVIDTVTLPAGTAGYSFGDLDRYDKDGKALAYTVEVEEIDSYITAVSDPTADDDGNITADITSTGDFAYGALTISSNVSGEDAPADAVFTYTVTFDSDVAYPYSGSATGTIRSGDRIALRDGESITISNILVGVYFTVVQDEAENFVTDPGDGFADVISSTEYFAEFTNKFELPPVGNLEITNKVIGNKADKTLKFPFRVEFDAEGSYELRIFGAGETIPVPNATGMLGRISISSAAGARATISTISSGDTILLAHGETAIIYGLPAGVAYKVTETDTQGYKLTFTGDSGLIAEDGSKASFINEKGSKVAGATTGPDTGDHGTTATAALYVMQLAMLAMLACVVCMKRTKSEDEAEQL